MKIKHKKTFFIIVILGFVLLISILLYNNLIFTRCYDGKHGMIIEVCTLFNMRLHEAEEKSPLSFPASEMNNCKIKKCKINISRKRGFARETFFSSRCYYELVNYYYECRQSEKSMNEQEIDKIIIKYQQYLDMY